MALALPERVFGTPFHPPIAQMAELGVVEVSVIGGEAYLRDDWLTIVRQRLDRRQ